jgi:pyruvate/2-oxoglutarate dehydrogenase complex dihydrolipoamide acyltransferase (E2) component
LCEIALPVATIGVDAKEDGILAKIVVGQYQTAPAEADIAVYVLNREQYMDYLAQSMADAVQAERLAERAEAEDDKSHKPDSATLMRVIKHLIQSGKIESGSGKPLHLMTEPHKLVRLEQCPLPVYRLRQKVAITGAKRRRGVNGCFSSFL